jgi:hypothetical protein
MTVQRLGAQAPALAQQTRDKLSVATRIFPINYCPALHVAYPEESQHFQ